MTKLNKLKSNYQLGSLKPLFFIPLIAFIVSCATPNHSQLDNYGLCSRYILSSPRLNTITERVVFGAITLGTSEIAERSHAAEFKQVRLEMDRRGLKACDARTLASYECEKIHSNQLSPEFQTCLLTVSNSIAARRASDAARAAAIQAALAAQDAEEAQQQNNPVHTTCTQTGNSRVINCTSF
jgi:hypothetical protein